MCKAPWLSLSSWESLWKYPYICSSDPLIDTDVVLHWQALGLVKNLVVVAYIIVGSAVNPILELSSWKSGYRKLLRFWASP